MKSIAKIILVSIYMAAPHSTIAQQVAKNVLVEHFTNTYCSICASRNPGFYNNLWHYPNVLHIAYHPSSPYPSCPLSMHNASENDARTNFYGVYGGTPRIVIQGNVIPASANYADTTLFSSQFNQTTSFTVNASIVPAGTDSIAIKVVIRKTDTSSLSSLELYGAIVEDTLFFTAGNGETRHYDVFRKALWGATSLSVTAPVIAGDSSVYTSTVALNAAWNRNRVYALAILQEPSKSLVQAAKTGHLPYTTAIDENLTTTELTLYPNPAGNELHIEQQFDAPAFVQIADIAGKIIMFDVPFVANTPIDVSMLQTGIYFISIRSVKSSVNVPFIKK